MVKRTFLFEVLSFLAPVSAAFAGAFRFPVALLCRNHAATVTKQELDSESTVPPMGSTTTSWHSLDWEG